MQILVVDDSKTIRFMLIRMLKELGYDQIAEAADVDAAMLQIYMKEPELIFSDFNMPGKSGLDFLKAVRQHPTVAKVPFVMITTMHDKKIIVDAVKAGLQYYILKPVEKSVLAEKLTALSETHHIQAPRFSAPQHQTVTSEAPHGAEPSAHKPGIAATIAESIAEHFFLVFDGEMTISDFQSWATENVLPALPADSQVKTGGEILDFLRLAAANGIQTALKQFGS
jgi:two-component system chemotaxis response regulator CheY